MSKHSWDSEIYLEVLSCLYADFDRSVLWRNWRKWVKTGFVLRLIRYLSAFRLIYTLIITHIIRPTHFIITAISPYRNELCDVLYGLTIFDVSQTELHGIFNINWHHPPVCYHCDLRKCELEIEARLSLTFCSFVFRSKP